MYGSPYCIAAGNQWRLMKIPIVDITERKIPRERQPRQYRIVLASD